MKSVNRRLSHGISALLMLLWPFVIWLGFVYQQNRWLPVLLILFFLLRLWVLKGQSGEQHRMSKMLACTGVALCLASALFHKYQLLLYYPVLVNGVLLLLFGRSLFFGMPLVEQLARWRDPQLPPEAVTYTRNLTRIWCLFFIVNGTVALATCLYADMHLWVLWNGMVSYLLIALLIGLEWLVRSRVIKKDE